jgi:chromosome segregation protein
MRLQTVSLFGFKSFADRTDVRVKPGITAIVGPNGCGKSNIADALRWALGEQSARALRGHRMEDVIFHGSTSRRPLGLAEVLLTFSNDGDVKVPWSEVSVGRRLYRDGESEYLLNRTACRLKDVQDLFLGTGVNPKAYALMEQERLAQILTGKPLDRRVFVEEAAGITRYKQQRTETLGKLEATRQNLQRVRDVMDEVKRQLGSLERQARRAKTYKALQAERRALDLVVVAGEHALLATEEHALGAEETAARDGIVAFQARAASAGADLEACREALQAAEHRAADVRHALQRAELLLENALGRVEQLRALDRDLGGELERLAEEGRTLTRRLDDLGAERQAREAAVRDLRAEFQERRREAASREGALETARRRLREARDAAEALRQAEVALAGRRTGLGQALGGLEERREQVGRRLGRVTGESAQARADCERVGTARREAGARLAEARRRVEELDATRARLAAEAEGVDAARRAAAAAADEGRVTLASRRSSLAALQALEAERAGYGQGVRAVFAAAREVRLRGVVGTVADLLEVPRDLERAVEAALGERLQWVVVDTFAAAKEALGYLDAEGDGQATFLPLDWLNGAPIVDVDAEAGVRGAASRLVESRYPSLVGNLLGSTVIVDDLRSAERLYGENGHGTSFVTVDGELLGPPGALGGGRARHGGDASLLARKRAIRDLEAAAATLAARLEADLQRARAAEATLAALQAEDRAAASAREAAEAERLTSTKDVEQLGREADRAAAFAEACDVELGQLRSERQAVDGEIAGLRAELQTVEADGARLAAEASRLRAEVDAEAAAEAAGAQAFLDVQVDLAGLAGRVQATEADVARLGTDLEDAGRRLAAGEERGVQLRARREEARGERERLEREAESTVHERDVARERARVAADEVQDLADRSRARGEDLREAEAALARVTQRAHDVAVRRAEVRVRREELEGTARRQLEVDVEALAGAHDPGRDLAAARAERDALGARIAALEPVNLVADDEYRELDERLAFLRAQHDDLVASTRDLEKALRGMTRTAQERFEEAFQAINRNFQDLFDRLFEGGRAELRLVEAPEDGDPLDTGIEMVAQPRGKRLQAISLLSGGEKALTGLALLFAIFYFRPSPFCLLDEVDAPLDDANIHRFTRVLRELSGQTQFLVITHNRKTMEAADALYGITMEEPGLSRVVSVSLA